MSSSSTSSSSGSTSGGTATEHANAVIIEAFPPPQQAVGDVPPFDVFIAHSGVEGKEFAVKMYLLMSAIGISCFFDRAMPLGRELKEIVAALYSCRIGLCLLSHKFFDSSWTQREALTLIKRRKATLARLKSLANSDAASSTDTGSNDAIVIPIFYLVKPKECNRYGQLGIELSQIAGENRMDRLTAKPLLFQVCRTVLNHLHPNKKQTTENVLEQAYNLVEWKLRGCYSDADITHVTLPHFVKDIKERLELFQSPNETPTCVWDYHDVLVMFHFFSEILTFPWRQIETVRDNQNLSATLPPVCYEPQRYLAFVQLGVNFTVLVAFWLPYWSRCSHSKNPQPLGCFRVDELEINLSSKFSVVVLFILFSASICNSLNNNEACSLWYFVQTFLDGCGYLFLLSYLCLNRQYHRQTSGYVRFLLMTFALLILGFNIYVQEVTKETDPSLNLGVVISITENVLVIKLVHLYVDHFTVKSISDYVPYDEVQRKSLKFDPRRGSCIVTDNMSDALVFAVFTSEFITWLLRFAIVQHTSNPNNLPWVMFYVPFLLTVAQLAVSTCAIGVFVCQGSCCGCDVLCRHWKRVDWNQDALLNFTSIICIIFLACQSIFSVAYSVEKSYDAFFAQMALDLCQYGFFILYFSQRRQRGTIATRVVGMWLCIFCLAVFMTNLYHNAYQNVSSYYYLRSTCENALLAELFQLYFEKFYDPIIPPQDFTEDNTTDDMVSVQSESSVQNTEWRKNLPGQEERLHLLTYPLASSVEAK